MSNDQTVSNYRGHLNHLEDLPLFYGYDGYLQGKKWIHRLIAGAFRYSLKYDGKFAIFIGRHEGKLFVSTKGWLNKKPIRLFNDQQINDYVRYQSVREVLERVLACITIYDQNISSTFIPNGEVWHGDYLFNHDTIENTLTTFQFQPNTLIYQARIFNKPTAYDTIRWHTIYPSGDPGDVMFNPPRMAFRSIPGIHNWVHSINEDVYPRAESIPDRFITAYFDLFTDPFDQEVISQIWDHDPVLFKPLLERWSNSGAAWNSVPLHIFLSQQKEISLQRFTSDSAMERAARRWDSLIAITAKHWYDIELLLRCAHLLQSIRKIMINGLDKDNNDLIPWIATADGGTRRTNHEGLVISTTDHKHAVKLVDRETFTVANRAKTAEYFSTKE